MQQSVIEYNGQKYVNTKVAADIWNLKQRTVSNYCKNGKVDRAIKYKESRWFIPIDSAKPLSDEETYKMLVMTLQLKNKPSLKIDWSEISVDNSVIVSIYRYLVFRGLIEDYDISDVRRLPYEVVLTQKGMEFVTSPKKKIEGFGTVMQNWISIIIGVAQLAVQIVFRKE